MRLLRTASRRAYNLRGAGGGSSDLFSGNEFECPADRSKKGYFAGKFVKIIVRRPI